MFFEFHFNRIAVITIFNFPEMQYNNTLSPSLEGHNTQLLQSFPIIKLVHMTDPVGERSLDFFNADNIRSAAGTPNFATVL